MEYHNHNLNIHYSSPPDVWDKLEKLYEQMPHWSGIVDGCPQWYGEDEKIITVSVEPSGLLFYAELPTEEWNSWFRQFKQNATVVLGYEIGEPEDGFNFHFHE